jgi:hypothetical protein
MKDNYSWLDKAQKTVDYLYSLDDSCPPELRQAIGILRQLTNEEFVHKDKTISSQLIWDILKEAFTKQIEIEKLRARIDSYIDITTKAGNGKLLRDYALVRANQLQQKLKELESKK